ncbi:MAG: SusD/RagB family nutrient-binding outer membrane lipoprotein [Bacteroidales bacterium]|nr:SusD/RagB family nutrient-binding outer membrane lipoprotein [Bacteroidales bacterium]
MKKILIILLAFLAVSCSKQKIADLNKDIKHPATVPGNTLFSYAEKSLSNQDADINVNNNDLDLWDQYLTETTYLDEANYAITTRAVPENTWQAYYIDVLGNLQRADSVIKGETTATAADKAALANRRTIIDILECYTWDQMETLWGNIPYSQALNINNTSPAYDDAFTIHKDLISRVTADVAALDPSNGSFGSADLIYGGDVSMWKAFGNGLLVKLGIQVADFDAATATSAIKAGMDGAIASADQNAVFQYLASVPNENPLNDNLVLSGRKDYVAANTIIDAMTGLNDPRLPFYFDQNMGANTYVGGTYGASSAYPNYTHVNSNIANNGAFPHPLMTYSEIQFYLAEAVARGLITGDAETYYNNAVTASIMYWGGTADQALTYISQPTVAYNQANWKELIGTQSWISFYTRWNLAYTQWRRLDFPVMNEPAQLSQYSSGVNTFPFRYPYPVNEETLNEDNWKAAVTAQGWSADDMNQKLYWDKN